MNNFFTIIFRVCFSTAIAAFCAVAVVILYTNAQLPSVEVLEEVQLQVPLKIYTADGKLIGEFGEKRRSPIEIKDVPEMLKLAILATEDSRFYEHNGIDLRAMARAGMHVMASGTKGQGASTITMQVARNFFLTRKKTFARKLNEVLLAIKIEQELPKDEILELYLNKIYFGKRAYGVQAAAQVYYGTTVDKLTLAQMAMIAGLPQAPSAINPINNPEAALKRRTHVLNRMLHYDFITEEQYERANLEPVATTYHGRTVDIEAPHVAEMARRELIEKFGTDIYASGYTVITTVDSHLQHLAHVAVRNGLLEYDKRHGYRGPLARLVLPKKNEPLPLKSWTEALRLYPTAGFLKPAVVISVTPQFAKVLMNNGEQKTISFESMRWARKVLPNGLGAFPGSAQSVVSVGDVIYIEPDRNGWRFSQVPEVQSALVAMYPKNGAILAMVGGSEFTKSYFNRAEQSTRQSGSNFKPFVYAVALDRGYTAATIVNDAPIVYWDPAQKEMWRPQNDNKQFYGPMRLRVGLTRSRNLVSIRILQGVGVKRTIKMLEKFGLNRKNLTPSLSLALGTSITSPLEMAMGYSVFANGGYRVKPHIIKEIQNSQGQVVYKPDAPIAVATVEEGDEEIVALSTTPPNKIDLIGQTEHDPKKPPAERALSPQAAYIMTSILQDVVKTGTARRALELKRNDLGGKTGTTQNQMDAWFTGFNQSLVTSVWVGFDEPRTLSEYGSQAALPIWMKFMGRALKDVPETKPEQPRGIVTVRIDPRSGRLAAPGQPNAIFEIFKQGTSPRSTARYSPQESQYGRPQHPARYGRDPREQQYGPRNDYGHDPRQQYYGRDPRDHRGGGFGRGRFRQGQADIDDMPPDGDLITPQTHGPVGQDRLSEADEELY